MDKITTVENIQQPRLKVTNLVINADHDRLMKKQAIHTAVRFHSHRAGVNHYLTPRILNSDRG